MASILGADTLLKLKNGTTEPASEALAGKDYVLLYFSAQCVPHGARIYNTHLCAPGPLPRAPSPPPPAPRSWCPPCRGFPPKLAVWDKEFAASKSFEVVFVSSDRGEEAFEEYYEEQPWLALPLSADKVKHELSQKFGVRGIPMLILLDKAGNMLTSSAREKVVSAPAAFPWQ